MTRIITSLVLFALLALTVSCTETCGPESTTSPPAPVQPSRNPFVGIDLSSLTQPQRAALEQASIDFERVTMGLPPTCKAEADSGFSDGGTLIYECQHYRLTVMKGIFTLHGIHGYLYGPVITFGPDESVSDVRFYTTDELSRLLDRK